MDVGVIAADGIKPRERVWFWAERIPAGAMTVLDGDPGVGKSLITCRLAASASGGDLVAGDTMAPVVTRGRVLFIAAEDCLETDFVPRLLAAGANLQQIGFLQAVAGGGGFRYPELPTDAALISELIRKHNIKLLVIDPITAYLSERVNTISDASIRRAVMPLLPAVQETGCALLLVRHLNKGGGLRALYRGAGSIGLVGMARSVLIAARDPEDFTTIVLAHVKTNAGKAEKALQLKVDTRGPAPVAVWGGETDLTADQLLLGQQVKAPKDIAMEFLRSFLKLPRPVLDVFRAAKAKGISERTLFRAKNELGVRTKRLFAMNTVAWFFPTETSTDQALSEADEAQAIKEVRDGNCP